MVCATIFYSRSEGRSTSLWDHIRVRINKRGNKKLRKILFFMKRTMITLRKANNHLVDYYDKLKKQPQRKAS